MDNFISISDVANIIGVNKETLRRWDKTGNFPSSRNPINNYRVYKPEDIELFLRKIESGGKIILGWKIINALKKTSVSKMLVF